jgi:hypothetical protein
MVVRVGVTPLNKLVSHMPWGCKTVLWDATKNLIFGGFSQALVRSYKRRLPITKPYTVVLV